jgi:DNA-binding transcriptional MerR regulator
MALRVGQLARRTGISVHTLHYYDEIGLLSPSLRSEGGYRLYTAGDVARLQQIRSLQGLGLALGEVRACLDRPDSSLLRTIELQISRLTEQIALQQRLRNRLHGIATRLRSAEEVSIEDLMQSMVVMQSMDKYYTPEQQEYLRQRREVVGEERNGGLRVGWAGFSHIYHSGVASSAGNGSRADRRRCHHRWRGTWTGSVLRVDADRSLYFLTRAGSLLALLRRRVVGWQGLACALVALAGRHQVLMEQAACGIAMVSGLYRSQFARTRLVLEGVHGKAADLSRARDRDPLVRAFEVRHGCYSDVLSIGECAPRGAAR